MEAVDGGLGMAEIVWEVLGAVEPAREVVTLDAGQDVVVEGRYGGDGDVGDASLCRFGHGGDGDLEAREGAGDVLHGGGGGFECGRAILGNVVDQVADGWTFEGAVEGVQAAAVTRGGGGRDA